MKAQSEALKRRWADPVYRERQIAANRRTNAERKVYFADPAARATHGAAVRIGWRIRKEPRRR